MLSLLGLEDKRKRVVKIANKSRTVSFPERSTLFDLMKFCVEIRAIPKKVALFSFSEFCSDPDEKCSLIVLSSKEGSELYDEFILKKHFGCLDLLKNFTTCKPDLRTFLDHSINLVPRYYSVIEYDKMNDDGSHMKSPKELNDKSTRNDTEMNMPKTRTTYNVKIAFNVTLLPSIYGRTNSQLFGIFTGKMNRIYEQRQSADLVNKMSSLSIDQLNLYAFKRKNLMFRLSDRVIDHHTIMISIGTGM